MLWYQIFIPMMAPLGGLLACCRPAKLASQSRSGIASHRSRNSMDRQRRRFLRLAATAAALPAASRLAGAQTYPSRPVRVIVPYAPAGSPDILGRLIGQWLSERLGQPFFVDNRPGGGSNIGTEAVVNAPPDGHTLLIIAPANA